ncbi:MAG: LEA type 2 family protein [Cytophagales bacterium]|nr:LEA type 2 family protein [Bernardetiaceae bacterium]MDW8203630.1 LEA type 2 family protein [Cytophagales bacterium]
MKVSNRIVLQLAIWLMAVAFFAACQSLRQMQNFARCAFRLESLSRFTAAGIDFSGKRSLSDFNFTDAAKITAALSGNNPFIFSFLANVEVKNPNAEAASVTQLDWILAIDGKDILQGAVNTPVQVAPNGMAIMPVSVSLDLKKIFAGENRDAWLGFAFDTVTKGNNSTRITLKVRPYVNIMGFSVPYPGYMAIGKDF